MNVLVMPANLFSRTVGLTELTAFSLMHQEIKLTTGLLATVYIKVQLYPLFIECKGGHLKINIAVQRLLSLFIIIITELPPSL